MGLEHVAIDVADMTASKQFYRDGLGFTVENEFASDDGTENAFLGGGSGAGLQLRRPVGVAAAADEAGRFDHLAVAVDDVAATVDRLVERTGCPVLDGPRAGHRATWIAFVADPDGFRVELIER